MELITKLFEAVLDIVNEMSPYLLLGFLIAGFMHAFIPNGWYARYLSASSFRSVINAAIFGVPLPLCSCGVIPTAMSLRREGASKGAVVSFLIATPQTGVDSIFATYSLMGLPFAIVRPIAALVTAILGGAFVNAFDDHDVSKVVNSENKINSEYEEFGLGHKLFEALHFAFVEMMEDIGKWLMVGLLIAGMITAFVPNEWFTAFRDNTLMSMLLVLAICIPMYVCATGSIPIAVALMMKGLTPGSALVLLMAGPAVNAASMLVVNKVLGRKTFILYLAAIVVGALCFGVGIDQFCPRDWFTQGLVARQACCHDATGWFNILCSTILILLLLNVLRMRLMHKQCCHHHECECNKREDNENEVYSLIVNGMTCNHCRANVEKAIQRVDGVVSVTVDLHTGTVKIEGKDVSLSSVKDEVESIGFEVVIE